MDFPWEAFFISLAMLGANGYAIKWLKGNLDTLRKEHEGLLLDLAKNYSTSDKIFQLIELMNAPVMQSIEGLKNEVKETKEEIKTIETKIDKILMNQGKR